MKSLKINLKKKLMPLTIIMILLIMSYSRNIVWQNEIELWKDTTDKSPQKARTWYSLGFYYIKKRQAYESIQPFMKAVELRPKYAEAWAGLGVAYAELGNYIKAKDMFENAVEIRPSYQNAWFNLGIILEHMGYIEDAIKSYRKALELNPLDKEAGQRLSDIQKRF